MSEDVFRRIAEVREAGVKRRRHIADMIGNLQAEDAALAKQDADLEHHERFLQTLLLPLKHPPPALSPVAAEVLSALESDHPKWSRRKPNDIPSVLEMANEAFAHFEADGKPWLTAREIAIFVRQKYWPEAKPEFFNGQLWRAAERGDLVKKGSCYARKGTRTEYDEGPAVVAEPSHSNGAASAN